MPSPWQESRRNSTFAKITFHTFDFGVIDGYASPLGGDSGGAQRSLTTRDAQLVGDIVSFTTTKQLAGDGGSWSVTCKGKVYGDFAQGGKTWSSVIRDGDWATINVVKNGVESHIMIGRVDTVAVAIQAGAHGEPSVTVIITGRDSTASPIDTPLHINPFDPLHNNAAGIDMYRLFGDVFAGAPHECVPRILTSALGDNHANFGHPPMAPEGVFGLTEMRWSDGVDIVARVSECRGFLFAPALLNLGQVQSLWGLANQYANPSFNELWLDTDPTPGFAFLGRKVYLNFRERPFVNVFDGADSPWYKLAGHIAALSTVQAINLSRGRNRVNYVNFQGSFASSFSSDSLAMAPPAYSTESIKRWGLRILEMTTMYLNRTAGGDIIADEAGENRKWRDLLVAWNALNADYWEGTITLAEMRPEIRVGSKLVLTGGPPANYSDFPHDGGDPAEAMTFYVEAIQHTWAAGQAPTAQTQLLLTHGYVEKSRLPDLIAALAEWKDVVGAEGAQDDSTLDDYPDAEADPTRYA